MKFFKENSYDIVRLFINQIGITIFSMIMYTALGMMSSLDSGTKLSINLVLSVFATLFYFALIYTVMWDIGAKDKIRIDGGRMEPVKLKGARMAFWANVPNFILTFVCVLTFAIYLIAGTGAAYNVSAVFNTIVRLLMSMYLGILQGVFAALRSNTDMYYFTQAIGYFVIPVFSIAVTQLGYHFGTLEKKIFSSSVKKKNP